MVIQHHSPPAHQCSSNTSEKPVFSGLLFLLLGLLHTIRSQKKLGLLDSIASDSEPFVLPGLPHRIELTKARIPAAFCQSPDANEVHNMVLDAELAADGMLFNSFEELEPEQYAKSFEAASGKKAWLLGPVSLFNKNASDKADRGSEAAIAERQCLESVVYVSFGSLCKLTAAQLMEIGLGLEASGKSFIWVVRKSEEDRSPEMEKWLAGDDGLEERVKGRGLVIRGWAPQILILSHPATAGFVTHCGWNSTLEGICAGLPMISWPLLAEHFLNEKLVVQVLGIALSMGVKAGSLLWDADGGEEMVWREEVEKAIARLMDGGEEGEERRKRAEELGMKTRKAMEVEGSSYTNMTNLIQHVMMSRAHQEN
ncbi:UDP-glycosyltransferase [Asimina triloba]